MSSARAALLLLLAGCQKAPTNEPQPAGSAVRSAASTAAAASLAAPAKAWFEGAWRGTFQAELQRIELPAGGVKEWKTDDGKRASGEGQLAFEVSPDGTASGSASGALGQLAVAGRVEGDRAALTLTSSEPDGFHGVILATQAGDSMTGMLNASSADSLQVRRANVSLSRAGK